MARIFIYEGREFPDPDPDAPVEEIKERMTDFFHELVNAEVKEAARGEDTLYEFVTKEESKEKRKEKEFLQGLREELDAVNGQAGEVITRVKECRRKISDYEHRGERMFE